MIAYMSVAKCSMVKAVSFKRDVCDNYVIMLNVFHSIIAVI